MTKEAITFKNVEEEDSKYKEQMELYKAFLMKQNPELTEQVAKKIINGIDLFSAGIEQILQREVPKPSPILYTNITDDIGVIFSIMIRNNICGGVKLDE